MKLQKKLFLLLFGFSLLLVSILVLLMQWSIGKGMVDYVNSKEIETLKPVVIELAKEYQVNNNWQNMLGRHDKFRALIFAQLQGSDFDVRKTEHPPRPRHFSGPESKQNPQPQNRPSPRAMDGRHPPPESESHYVLLDSNENFVVGSYLESLEYSKTPITVDKEVVGYFAVSKRNSLTQGYELDFLQQQKEYLWVIALLLMSLVGLVTFPLARHVIEPIKQITLGMHKLTQGDYQQSIDLDRRDELGDLSRDYNELAITLAANESARKRWLANISHELRTPVAILRGELEAMLDNVRPLTIKNIGSANDEVKHLQRLIDDLNLLTSADIGGMHYRKQPENLTALIQGEVEKYQGYLADTGITLKFIFDKPEINIYGDKTRLCQLFENIINNCIKYATATELHISLLIDDSHYANNDSAVIVKFADNGVGVDEQHFEHLFEHLYRVEDSRNRKTGGSGLGLSICRHIVQAHQGQISAEKSTLGGLAIVITLPLA